MKILFLVYHGFSEVSGISKKIHYQVKGLRENGHDVRLCYYGFAENGHRCRYVDDKVIKDYGTGKWAGIRQRLNYNCIYDYCIQNNIQFVYARCFQNANPWLIHFFKKLRDAGVHAVTEIPTYPYDAEFVGFPFQTRMNLKVDQLFRHKLYAQMDAIVTFSDAKEIFGQRTINISNGVDFDSIPLHQPSAVSHQSSELHLIGVAEVHYWHGYDRMIAGIGEYYKNGGKKDVFFHVVRNIDDVPAAFNVVVMLAHERLIDIVQKFAIEVEIEDREERRKNDREDTDDLENEFHSVHLFLTRSGCHRSRAATGREALRA